MRINLAYGTEQVPVDVPDNWINGRCYRPHPLEECPDERAALIAAMEAAPENQELGTVARGKPTCAIAVDGSEPGLFKALLPGLIELIEDETQVSSADITIVVANRPWRPFNRGHLKRVMDARTLENYRIVLHDPRDTSSLVSTGVSTQKIPLTVNKAYAEAELKVVLGGVRPDDFLGFTGGRAVIMPGLCGVDTLRAMYSYENVANEKARYGAYRDNPFHMAGVEAATAAGCDLAVSATITPAGRVERIFAGHFGSSHIQAMNAMKEALTVLVKEPMDMVVTSGGGDPYDRTLMQAVTALNAVLPVLKPGGSIVLSAALESGFGTEEFCEMLVRHPSPREGLEALKGMDDHIPGQWVVQRLFSILRAHEVILFNRDVEEDAIWGAGLTPARDLNEAVHGAMESHGQRCRIVALPEGPFGIAEIGKG